MIRESFYFAGSSVKKDLIENGPKSNEKMRNLGFYLIFSGFSF